MPDTPLNPDAHALRKAVEAVHNETFGAHGDLAHIAVNAYVYALAAAQPEVNRFDPRELNRRGWTCGCEPGNYDSCDECQSACNDLANFLNRTEATSE